MTTNQTNLPPLPSELIAAVGDYWDVAYAEGKDNALYGDKANEALRRIYTAVHAHTQQAIEADRAARAQQVPDGFVLVPKRLTSEMFFAWTGTKVFDDGLPHEQYQACYRAMLSAAPSTKALYGWQPIETAPKDGTAVLVYPPTWGDRTAAIANWDEDGYAKKPRPYWSRNDDLGKVMISRERPPTHWMPLPAAPSAPTKENKA